MAALLSSILRKPVAAPPPAVQQQIDDNTQAATHNAGAAAQAAGIASAAGSTAVNAQNAAATAQAAADTAQAAANLAQSTADDAEESAEIANVQSIADAAQLAADAAQTAADNATALANEAEESVEIAALEARILILENKVKRYVGLEGIFTTTSLVNTDNDTGWVTRLTLDATAAGDGDLPVPARDYDLVVMYGFNHDSVSSDFVSKVQIDEDGTVTRLGQLHRQEPKDSAGVLGSTGTNQGLYVPRAFRLSLSGPVTITLEFGTDDVDDRSSIFDASIRLEEV